MSKTFKKFGNKNIDRRFEKKRKIIRKMRVNERSVNLENKNFEFLKSRPDSFLNSEYFENDYQKEDLNE